MPYEIITEGFVHDIATSNRQQIAEGPRCVYTDNKELICSFFAQKAHGINDFEVMMVRSKDKGLHWTGCRSIWPDLIGRFSISCSISRGKSGELFLYGTRTPINRPGEPNWCAATQGLKQNELVYARSNDDGRTWSELKVIPMPIAGAAEAPGTLCVTSKNRWIAPYAPYNTFDPNIVVERNQVIAVYSDDCGKSWQHASMMKFDECATGAEAWIVELSDSRLIGTCWHMNQQDGSDFPNAYAISHNGGCSWTKTQSTGIMGQASALAALDDGRALFVYNQRKAGTIGVWIATARPDDASFNIDENVILWEAETRTRSGMTSGGHSEWRDFSFGEPSVVPIEEDMIFVVFWCIQPSGSGIRYILLKQTA